MVTRASRLPSSELICYTPFKVMKPPPEAHGDCTSPVCTEGGGGGCAERWALRPQVAIRLLVARHTTPSIKLLPFSLVVHLMPK